MAKQEQLTAQAAAPKQQWVEPRLEYVGNVGEVLQGGGGKLSNSPNDPGEVRKVVSTG